MQVAVVGLDHKKGTLSEREVFAKALEQLLSHSELSKLYSFVPLFTCNRAELYFSAHDLILAKDEILKCLPSMAGYEFYSGKQSMQHLVQVTAGLESALAGETDIQRQVKEAYSKYVQQATLSSPIHFLFQKSLKIAKDIRSHFSSLPSETSLEATLFDLGKQSYRKLQEKSILFLGNSKMNRKLIDYFSRKGCQRFFLVTRNPQSASFLQDKYELSIFKEVTCAPLHQIDWIIAATGANDYLITQQHYTSLQKPLLICDLSVPRVVDPQMGGRDTVTLLNMEAIHALIKKRQSIRIHDLKKAQLEIKTQVARQMKIFHNKQQATHIKVKVCA
jgi:glutamyl-tRNA reductase